ncbi:MAG: PEP-utilizing enzyme, partial [Pseudonocardia sp.]
TSPEDVHAMIAAVAVCTETGGSTSHAAVVCRGLGRPAVVGCGPGAVERLTGREVTADGGIGTVFAGRLPLRQVDPDGDERLRRLRTWAAEEAGIEVVASGEPGEPVLDLDALGVVGAADLAGALAGAGGVAVRGGVVETADGVAAAIRAGVRRIVAAEPLPVLLAAAAHRRAEACSAAGARGGS